MKDHTGVVKVSGLIRSLVATATNVHDLNLDDDLLHGDEKFVYGEAGYEGISKRLEMAAKMS